MLDIISAVILGIIEGITEFLPVSSTGHLIVATEALGVPERLRGTIEIFIQLGAVIAVVIYYRRDLWRQARTVTTDPSVRRLWLNIVIAFIPAAVVGLLARDWIDENLFSPSTVALALIVGGVVFIVIERALGPRIDEGAPDMTQITPRDALLIGIAQVAALFPGVSRAAATIFGGMLIGLNRPAATQFSFYLAIPTLGAATIITLILDLDQIQPGDWTLLLVGLVVAGIVAYTAIAWLLNFIARNTFAPFGVYRIVAGMVILVLVAAGAL